MTPEQKSHARRLWQTKLTVAEIAEEVGVGIGAIQHLAVRNRDKFPPRPHPTALTPDQITQASKLWNQHYTADTIAIKLKVTRKQIDNAVRADREKFPRRNDTRLARMESFAFNYEKRPSSGIRPDAMIFTTSFGYQCLMPRISILERAI